MSSELVFQASHDREQVMLPAWLEKTTRELTGICTLAQEELHLAQTRLDEAHQRFVTRRTEVEYLERELDEPDQRYATARKAGRSFVLVSALILFFVEWWSLQAAFVARHASNEAAWAYSLAGVLIPAAISYQAGAMAHRAAKYEGPARVQHVAIIKAAVAVVVALVAGVGVVLIRLAGDSALGSSLESAGLENQTSPYIWTFYLGLQAVQLIAFHEGWRFSNPRKRELEGARIELDEVFAFAYEEAEIARDDAAATLAELEEFDPEAWACLQAGFVQARYNESMLDSRATREQLLTAQSGTSVLPLALYSLPKPQFKAFDFALSSAFDYSQWTTNGFTINL